MRNYFIITGKCHFAKKILSIFVNIYNAGMSNLKIDPSFWSLCVGELVPKLKNRFENCNNFLDQGKFDFIRLGYKS